MKNLMKSAFFADEKLIINGRNFETDGTEKAFLQNVFMQ